jgi:hypothetical protein
MKPDHAFMLQLQMGTDWNLKRVPVKKYWAGGDRQLH